MDKNMAMFDVDAISDLYKQVAKVYELIEELETEIKEFEQRIIKARQALENIGEYSDLVIEE